MCLTPNKDYAHDDNFCVSNSCKQEPYNPYDTEDPPVSDLLAYLKHLKLSTILSENIDDPRKGNCKYTLSSLITTALSIVSFRCGSKDTCKIDRRD